MEIFNHVLLTILPITFDAHSSLPSFIVIRHHEKSYNLELFRSKHGKFAVCNLCQAPLKYQNSTSSLQYHVKSKHKDKIGSFLAIIAYFH